MDSISKKVFIETQYPGVTLGVISFSRGLVQIDAPPSPEDGRSWRATLMGLSGGPERILINLDAHPDRTLGVRAMDCSVIAHEETGSLRDSLQALDLGSEVAPKERLEELDELPDQFRVAVLQTIEVWHRFQ